MGSTNSLLDRLTPVDPPAYAHHRPPLFQQGVSRVFSSRVSMPLPEFQLLLSTTVPGFPTPLILSLYRAFCSTSGMKASGLTKLLGALQGSPTEVADLLFTLYFSPHHRPNPRDTSVSVFYPTPLPCTCVSNKAYTPLTPIPLTPSTADPRVHPLRLRHVFNLRRPDLSG